MKRLITILFLAVGLASGASAHHPSPSENAGGNMSSTSGHLDLRILPGLSKHWVLPTGFPWFICANITLS